MRISSRFMPSFFRARIPISDHLLLLLVGSHCSDEQFVTRVRDVVFSEESLMAAKLLLPLDAQKVIDKLDMALDVAAIDGNKRLRRRCLKYLCWICGHHRLLPSAYKLTATPQKGEMPVDGGGFADVWRGVYNGRQVAIKILRVYETSNIEEVGKRFCREVLMWSRRQNPNILPLLGVSAGKFIMVSDWMENGNVRQYLSAHPDVNRPLLLLGATDGLVYIHSLNLVHGDLKGANILIAQNGSSVLADFGLATIVPTETTSFSFSASHGGTYRWMSPELLLDLGGSPGRTVHSDRYAFGMVIYEVLTGNIPFHPIGGLAAITEIVRGARPDIPANAPTATHGLWGIVQRCWGKEPAERPPLSEIREELGIAAEEWDAGPGVSGSTDSFVRVAQNILSSSGRFSDTDSDNDTEQGMSSYSPMQYVCARSTPELAQTPASADLDGYFNQHQHRPTMLQTQSGKRTRVLSLHEPSQSRPSVNLGETHPRTYSARQSSVVQATSAGFVGLARTGVKSDDADSEDDLEPPDFVYNKPKSHS